MGALLGNLALLRADTRAHVMGLHHGTKDDGTNSRGHSVLPNGVDTIAQAEWRGDGAGIGTVTLGFARDDVAGALGAFRTEVVKLGHDADGDPITTLLIEELDPTEKPRKQPDSRRLPDKTAAMLDVFRNVIAQHGVPILPMPDMPLVTALRRSELRDGLIDAGWFNEGQLCEALQGKPSVSKAGLTAESNALTGLKRRGFLAFNRHYVWLP